VRLKRVEIKGYRGISNLEVELDDICVFIGENNAGKTSVLDAIRTCLTRPANRRAQVFSEYDYHFSCATTDPSTAEPIEIVLTFAEQTSDEWPDEVLQLMEGVLQDDDGLNVVILRTSSRFDKDSNDFVTDNEFLDLSKNPLSKSKSGRAYMNLQQILPTFYLASLRDAAQEFRPRSQFWGPFVKSMNLTADDQRELEQALAELNKKILEKHTAFEDVKGHLGRAAQLLPLGSTDPVIIEALPSKVFDILSRTQVSLSAKTGAKIPVVRHGNGTQSLAVICLFDAFLRSRLADGYGTTATPLLALEEPEAHLHPSAVKAVGEMLQSLGGQKLITTHSGDLLAGVPLTKIRRLRRKDGNVVVHQLTDGTLTPDEIQKLDYKVRATRGSLMFSRCWLLVEGETEGQLLMECARAMGHDLYTEGVSFVEFAQVGIEKYIKLADQFGIEWFFIGDNDPAGETYRRSACDQLNGRSEKEHIRLLDHGNIEVFLCMEGYGHIYETNISPQKKIKVTAENGTLEYWKQVADAQSKNGKPAMALAVAESIAEKGTAGVPKLFQDVVAQALKLARSVA
jgi:putative ATP-dependent endonuclease of OLD family